MNSRRRNWYMTRILGVTNSSDRVAAAMDYLRAVMADLPEGRAREFTDDLVGHIVRLAEEASVAASFEDLPAHLDFPSVERLYDDEAASSRQRLLNYRARMQGHHE